MRRRGLGRAAAARRVLALGGAAVLLLTGGGAAPTTAAWTDPAQFAVTASAGTWSPPRPTPGCSWLDASGRVVGTCTLGRVATSNVWNPVGNRMAVLTVTVTVRYPANAQHYRVTVDLAGALPADWRWSTSGIMTSQLVPAGPVRCGDLPIFTGDGPYWGNGTHTFHLQVVENRANASPLLPCA